MTSGAPAALALLSLLLLGAAPLRGQFFDRAQVLDASVSGDGRLVAYTMRTPASDGNHFVDQVHLLPASGGSPELLGEGRRPAFAREGTAVARLVTAAGHTTLVIRDAPTSPDRTITPADLDVVAYRWSPDGSSIAFAARSSASVAVRATRAGDDNAQLALYLVPVAGDDVRRITAADFAVGPAESELPDLIEFDWLDASRLVVSGRVPAGEESADAASLYIVDAASGSRRYLAGAGGRWHLPRVAPNGEWIAFTGQALGGAGWMPSELIVLRPDGSGLKRLTVGLDRDALDLAWDRDSRNIWFATEDRGSRNIQRVDIRNGRIGTGTSGTHLLSLEAVAPRGDWGLAVRRTQTSPGALVRFPLDRPHEFQVMVEAVTAAFDGEIEELDFAAAGGGTLHGWLFRPPGFVANTRHPLVVEIHGGPHAMAGAGYSPSALAYATAGALVLRMNPRGSTGFGYDIATALADRWPGGDVDDIRMAITELIARGLVDSTRITVAGTGAGAVTAAALRQADARIGAAILRCAGGGWLPGGSGIDPAPWSEWYASRPFASSASRWWQQAGLRLRGESRAPVLVIEPETPRGDAVAFGASYARELARQGVAVDLLQLSTSCADARPDAQAELFRLERGVQPWQSQDSVTAAP